MKAELGSQTSATVTMQKTESREDSRASSKLTDDDSKGSTQGTNMIRSLGVAGEKSNRLHSKLSVPQYSGDFSHDNTITGTITATGTDIAGDRNEDNSVNEMGSMHGGTGNITVTMSDMVDMDQIEDFYDAHNTELTKAVSE